MAYLEGRGVRTQIMYPKLVPDQGAYETQPWRAADDMPVARSLFPRVLCLPMFAELADDEVDRVIAAILDFYAGG
jgi:dTDP-4-amino-4,6-dideoxygalactose transaminase